MSKVVIKYADEVRYPNTFGVLSFSHRGADEALVAWDSATLTLYPIGGGTALGPFTADVSVPTVPFWRHVWSATPAIGIPTPTERTRYFGQWIGTKDGRPWPHPEHLELIVLPADPRNDNP